MKNDESVILILDFGSQLTQLIARRLRDFHFHAEIYPYNLSLETIKARNPKGIVLSGGPQSVYDFHSPRREVAPLLEIAPVLGICYGMQLLAHQLGGKVEASNHREYGREEIQWQKSLLPKMKHMVWMSHGDVVTEVPESFEAYAFSQSGHLAAMGNKNCLGLQFHPEVTHTELGDEILEYFATEMCEAKPTWRSISILQGIRQQILRQVKPEEEVLVALSGGVDSTVVAKLLTDTLGAQRVHCVFVDTGLLRWQESEEVLKRYEELGLKVYKASSKEKFLKALKGLTDPEAKRKTIGRLFIEIFDEEVKKLKLNVQWLAQGTLYPDVIESVSPRGESVTIKSHHNVGGLPEKMNLKLLEPIRELFKDEVRRIGKELGLPEEALGRHPFPGPGLAIRILGEVNEKSLDLLQKADHIFISELKNQGLYHHIWQAFVVLLPVQSVGVMGDARTYDQVVALRAVTSHDGMTADWYPFSFEFLSQVSNRITNEVKGINRVVYDVTSKPPGTIEWE